MANLILHKRMSITQYNTFKTLHTDNGVLDDEFKNTLFVLNETGTFSGTDDCIFYMGEHLISYADYKKALSLTDQSTDSQFPTAKCVYDFVNAATTLKNAQGFGLAGSSLKKNIPVTLSNYKLDNGFVSVLFPEDVPASATININNTESKPIHYKGVAIDDGIIEAGSIATFYFDGTYYHLISSFTKDNIYATSIPYAVVDSNSTSSAYTATVPGITVYRDGVCVMLKNDSVTAVGTSVNNEFTININNLGAKPVYNSMMTTETEDKTIFSVGMTLLFIYDSTKVSGGCWICYKGFYSDTNTDELGIYLKTSGLSLPASDTFYRYRLLFTSANGSKLVPANTDSSTSTSDIKTVNQTPIDPFGKIVYYYNTATVNSNDPVSDGYLYDQRDCNLGYSFKTSSADPLNLSYPTPVYIKCAPQRDGSAIIDSTTPFTQTLPSTADNKIYIRIGYAYKSSRVFLTEVKPVYYHDGQGIRLWAGVDTMSLRNMYVGTCDTGAATSNKTVTVTQFPTDSDGMPLVGTTICVKFTNTNSAATPRLNVNGIGNKNIYGTATLSSLTASVDKQKGGISGGYIKYMWDGTYWVFMGWSKDFYSYSSSSMFLNVAVYPVSDDLYRYRLLFTSKDNQTFVPANTTNSTSATDQKTVNTRPINPFGQIGYYYSTTILEAGSSPAVSTVYPWYQITLGYSFNNTGAALTMTVGDQVYVKCNVAANGDVTIDPTNPIVFSLPATKDGCIYIHLGWATSATAIQLMFRHPVYYNDGYGIKLWTGDSNERLINTTWQNLKTLRDNSSLVPGQQYRITDYTCTTTQTDTQSAGHVFDIIVTADDVNVLNENARATRHSGDMYFQDDSKIEAWKLKYCIDNDTDRFAWADSTNGKGVIFWMKDEWNNECPYDFKNIQFKRYRITACQKSPNLVGLFGVDNIDDYTIDNSITYWSYTFCMIDVDDSNAPHDVSVEQDLYLNDEGSHSHTYSNIINIQTNEEIICLPNNVFITDTDICNINLEEDYGEFYGFFKNTFGNNCYYNTFGNNSSNTFGNSCYHNTFGNDCYYNTFGNDCFYNTFGNDCFYNTFGNDCFYNTFGNGCHHNTFENECTSNTFGNNCKYNTFGNNCRVIKFGNSILTKSYYKFIIVENGNQYIYLDTTQTTSSSNYIQNIKIAQGVNNTSTYKTISHNTVNDTFQTVYQPANSQIISV